MSTDAPSPGLDAPAMKSGTVGSTDFSSLHGWQPFAVTAGALLTWYVSLRSVELTELSSWGLLTSVSPLVLAAPLVAFAAMAVSMSRGASGRVLTAHMVAIVVMMYGAGAMVSNSLQARIVLRHEGVADQVLQSGSIDPNIDAYFNWPGFFTATAYVREIAGIESFASISPWAPVAFNIIYLAPLLVIFRQATSDRRIVWASVSLFYLGNWIGQDYFAPQAISYVIHLTIIALLLSYFSPSSASGTNQLHSPRQRVVAMAMVIVMFSAVVPSHQLTPGMTVISVLALTLFRQCPARRLPWLLLSIQAAWLVFGSRTYLVGNLTRLLDLVGDLEAATGANVTERVAGSVTHQLVVKIRLGFTALVVLLAVGGWLRRNGMPKRISAIVHAKNDGAMTLLAIAPWFLILLQPYGGEMILRVFLFTLPFLAFFAAHSIRWSTSSRWPQFLRIAVAGSLVVAMTLLFFVARYGNASLDQFSDQERATIDELYDTAPAGSLLLAAVDNLTWKYRLYDTHDHKTLRNLVSPEVDARGIAEATADLMYERRDTGAYFIATASQQEYIDLLGGLPLDVLREVEAFLSLDPNIELVADLEKIRIYALLPAGSS